MKDAVRAIGERIRHARESRSLRVATVAERMECDESEVRRWELGYIEPKATTIRKLADAIGCDVGELL